jgi:hypothetical protein
MGKALGQTCKAEKVDVLLGPGCNIKRSPLCGRNFEYFSEDPLLTGLMAVAQVKALEKSGVTPVIKHFCANNRETQRREMSSRVSSRALREIYLPETVSFIGEDAFAGCASLQGIYFDESSPSAVRGIDASSTRSEEAEEVARYNLSGHPCSPNDKGVQIIVYSDFTTRTIIVN